MSARVAILAGVTGGVVAGLASVGSHWLAAAILLLGLGAIMAPWALVLASLATVRGFEILLPTSGELASWQAVSYALALLAIAKALTTPRSPRPIVTVVPMLLAAATVGWLLLGSIPVGRVLTPPLILLLLAGLMFVPVLAPGCRRYLLTGIVVLTLAEVALSAPQLLDRLHGVHVDDPHQLGVALLASIAIVVGGGVQWRYRRVVLLVLILALLATQARGIWFAAAVLLVVAILPHLSMRRLVLAVVGLGVVGMVLFTPVSASLGLNLESAEIRRESISAGWERGLESPVFGQGWERTEEATGSERTATLLPFNAPVFFFAVGGVAAVLLFVGALAAAIRAAVRRGDRVPYLFLAAFTAVSLAEMPLYPGSISAPLFFLFIGMACVRTDISTSDVASRYGRLHGRS